VQAGMKKLLVENSEKSSIFIYRLLLLVTNSEKELYIE